VIHAWHRRRLSEYLDGALAGPAKARLERHLERCEECRSELAELRGTVLLLRTLAAEEEEDEFLATRVLARIAAGDAAPGWADRARDALAMLLSGAWAPALSAVAVLFVVATVLRVQVDIRLPSSAAPAAPLAATPVGPQPEVASIGPLTQEIRLVQTPVRSRRRFDPVVLEEVSGVHRACAASPHDAECQGFRNNLVNLALGDPSDFVREIESFPPESRDRVLSAVFLETARTGHTQRVIRGLRSVEDPRVFGIVVRFQRTIASRE
jgi:Putative zinc-finger